MLGHPFPKRNAEIIWFSTIFYHTIARKGLLSKIDTYGLSGNQQGSPLKIMMTPQRLHAEHPIFKKIG